MRKISTAIAALATVALATPASAGVLWLTDDVPSTPSGAGRIFSDGTVNVRVSAWSIDSGGTIRDAYLGVYDYGLGVSNGGGDNSHTVDNSGWNDFLLFQFDQSVELENAWFRTGWHNMNDTDATIGYGTSALPYTSQPPLDGVSAAVLAGANLYDSASWGNSGNSYRNINPLDHAGNFWLIGASFDEQYYDWKKDGFKLKKITYDIPPPAVPEPATWLMMILGFGLVGGVMRREKRKDAPALA